MPRPVIDLFGYGDRGTTYQGGGQDLTSWTERQERIKEIAQQRRGQDPSHRRTPEYDPYTGGLSGASDKAKKWAAIRRGLVKWVRDPEKMAALVDQQTLEPLDLSKRDRVHQNKEMYWQYVVQTDPTYNNMSKADREEFTKEFRESLNPMWDYENLVAPEPPEFQQRPREIHGRDAIAAPIASHYGSPVTPHSYPPPKKEYIGPSKPAHPRTATPAPTDLPPAEHRKRLGATGTALVTPEDSRKHSSYASKLSDANYSLKEKSGNADAHAARASALWSDAKDYVRDKGGLSKALKNISSRDVAALRQIRDNARQVAFDYKQAHKLDATKFPKDKMEEQVKRANAAYKRINKALQRLR